MKPQDLLKFKNLFIEQKKALLEASQLSKKSFELSRDDLMDEVDLTSAEREQALQMRLKGRELHLLRKIDEALFRMDSGTYGICEGCDVEIELRRLEVRPTATHCIECKEAKEHQEEAYSLKRKPRGNLAYTA